jgi:hypothetical protein
VSDPGLVGWATVGEPSLGITVQAPEGWSATATPAFALQLIGPAVDGYRASVSFSHERFDPPTPAGLERWMARTLEAQQRDYEGYEHLRHGPLLVDGRPANAVHYRWHPDAVGADLEALLAVVVVEPGLLLEVDAANLAGPGEPMARALQILSTVRFAPDAGARSAPD